MGKDRLGLGAAWAMAVGGMIGGGIFATLGVVISLAGSWAWASFLIGGLIALTTGLSYARLTVHFDREGGTYSYLRATGHGRLAPVVAWLLLAGYTLTLSVYAFTFGAYLANALGIAWLGPVAAVTAIAVLARVNLMGVGEAAGVEIFAVWVKLAVLVALAGFGLWRWAPHNLSLPGGRAVGWSGALIGAAAVFMSYEGFELLAFDYGDMENRQRTITKAMPRAIVATTLVYIAVAIGTAMLVGAQEVVTKKEVALAAAGKVALGEVGLIAVTIAATLSTASAINATLFASSRLSRDVAKNHDLPGWFAREDKDGVPWLAVLLIGGAAALLAVIGGLQTLVQDASFVFLGVFALVNWLAARLVPHGRWQALLGMAGAILAALTLALHLSGLI